MHYVFSMCIMHLMLMMLRCYDVGIDDVHVVDANYDVWYVYGVC